MPLYFNKFVYNIINKKNRQNVSLKTTGKIVIVNIKMDKRKKMLTSKIY